jgi:hypothetical protein
MNFDKNNTIEAQMPVATEISVFLSLHESGINLPDTSEDTCRVDNKTATAPCTKEFYDSFEYYLNDWGSHIYD